MKVVLIRHSKTAGNLMGRYIGTTDEPLCPEGVGLLRERKYPPVEGVYVSPLKRCRQTAEILYPSLEQRVEDDLRECDFGEFENKNYQELNGNPSYQAWVDSQGTLPFPDGESREGFRERCREAFLRIVEDGKRRGFPRIAVVAHGGTLMSILEAYAVPKKPFYDWQVKNGEGFLLEIPSDFAVRRELTVLEKI